MSGMGHSDRSASRTVFGMVAAAHEWVRPYTPGRGRLVVAAWELGALAFLQETTVSLFRIERFDTVLADRLDTQ